MHIFVKVGFAANEAATSLKMVDKGFKREDLAVAVLIDFPFQIAGGWLAAKWSRGDRPLRPWIQAFWPRLGLCLIATLIVYWFPMPPISATFFIFLIVHTVLISTASSEILPNASIISNMFSLFYFYSELSSLLEFLHFIRVCPIR